MSISENSRKISELLSVESIMDSDIFAVSNLKIGETSDNTSHKFTFGFLYDMMEPEIEKNLNIGSMAYESKYDYAMRGHTHDFSKVRYGQMTHEGNCIGKISISSNNDVIETPIILPLYADAVEQIPTIGELKLIYGVTDRDQDIQNSINDGTFDGWVYPNGKEYKSKQGMYDFTEACEIYGGTSCFNVPNLNQFFKLGYRDTDALKQNGYQVGIENHTHSINESETHATTYTKNIEHEFKSVNYHQQWDSTVFLRGSEKGTLCAEVKCDAFTVELSNKNGKTQTDVLGETNESYPRHNVIPCMVYIGKRKKDE